MSFSRVAITIAAMFVIGASASAGTSPKLQDPEVAARSQKVQENMRRIDLLMQLMPLIIRKDQFDKILPVYAKIKAEQRKVLEDEDKQLLALEAEVNESLKKARENGVFPKKDLVKKCILLVRALGIRRIMARGELSEMLYKTIDECFDSGQKKVMTSIDWKELDPSADLTGKSDADKMKFFNRVIFLDPLAYDILLDLDKKARASGL